jgi:Excalibur calcium-binding domain
MSFRWGAVVLALVNLGWAGAVASYGATQPKSYKNCAALHQDYPHGVGRKAAKDKTASGKPVTDFKVSNAIYSYNDGKSRRLGEKDLDRDNDGIACEER